MASSSKEIIISYLKGVRVAKAKDFSDMGITGEHLSRMVNEGILVRTSRGVYRLVDDQVSESGHFAEVAKRVPEGVITLLSALRYHEIGTQNPSAVWLAINQKAWKPNLDYPPVRIVRFSGKAYLDGIEFHVVDGVKVPVYSVAKTVADCFKFRNKIGLDIAIEALKDSLGKSRLKLDDLWRYASVCRVKNVIRPYVEALI